MLRATALKVLRCADARQPGANDQDVKQAIGIGRVGQGRHGQQAEVIRHSKGAKRAPGIAKATELRPEIPGPAHRCEGLCRGCSR